MRLARPDDGGAVALELVAVFSALVAMVLLVVYAGRVGEARADVTGVARSAARAASQGRSREEATARANAAALAAASTTGRACADVSVAVSGEFVPQGRVTVEVSCSASSEDLGLPAAPRRVLVARATEPFDLLRGMAP